MSDFKVAKSSTVVSPIAYRRDVAHRHLLTTADAAQELQVSRWRVIQLAEQGDLACDLTRSGQFIFTLKAVRALRDRRADHNARPRAEQLRAVRCRMLKAPLEPRQLNLLGRRHMRLVTSSQSERSLYDCGTKDARSGAESRESERRSSVNRKVASR
jgi:hypothetical protein